MSKFDFISNKIEYKEIYDACDSLESIRNVEDKAIKCREALELIVKYIYRKENQRIPSNATLLELIDGNIISRFVNNAIILDSIHLIRILGMNATHGNHIKKTHVTLAFKNLIFFVRFMVEKYEHSEGLQRIVLPKYMSEADTRKIYIDIYLGEAGWDVVEPNSETKLPEGTVVKSGTVFPSRACCEIPVTGMPNQSGIGFCDYVLYGKDGKPLAIVEAKNVRVEALVGQQQVKTYGECMKAEYGYVPVLYYTNGYEIYVIDGTYPSRKVMAFHSLEELEYMIQKRDRNDISDFRINDEISSRPYQKMAITNVCERFNEKQRRSLIVSVK